MIDVLQYCKNQAHERNLTPLGLSKLGCCGVIEQHLSAALQSPRQLSSVWGYSATTVRNCGVDAAPWFLWYAARGMSSQVRKGTRRNTRTAYLKPHTVTHILIQHSPR